MGTLLATDGNADTSLSTHSRSGMADASPLGHGCLLPLASDLGDNVGNRFIVLLLSEEVENYGKAVDNLVHDLVDKWLST